MIPHLTSLLEMNGRGEMPMDEIVDHVVKSIALTGTGSDYTSLPEELKGQIRAKIAWCKKAGGWFLVSNNGFEDYGPYAEALLAKVSQVE